MRVCVTQRRGIRYFTKFTEIAQRDKLEIELHFEDNNSEVVVIDLTQALLDKYSKHPLVGKVIPVSIEDAAAQQTRKPLVIKRSMDVSPAYLSESKKEMNAVLVKVHEAQRKAAEEAREKKAKAAADRAQRLAAARAVKAASAVKAEEPKRSVKAVSTKVEKPTPAVKAKEPVKSKKADDQLCFGTRVSRNNGNNGKPAEVAKEKKAKAISAKAEKPTPAVKAKEPVKPKKPSAKQRVGDSEKKR